MKKGCFIKSVIILTILVAAILYIVENKFDDFILKPAKEIFIPTISKEIDKDLNKIKPSRERDSLKILINNYLSDIKENSSISKDKIEDVAKSIESSLKDSVVTPTELNKIKKLMDLKKIK